MGRQAKAEGKAGTCSRLEKEGTWLGKIKKKSSLEVAEVNLSLESEHEASLLWGTKAGKQAEQADSSLQSNRDYKSRGIFCSAACRSPYYILSMDAILPTHLAIKVISC